MESGAFHKETSQNSGLGTPLEGELDLSVLDLMDAIAARHITPIPPASFTRKQFAARFNLTVDQVIPILNAEVELGNLQCQFAPCADGHGGRELVYWEPEK